MSIPDPTLLRAWLDGALTTTLGQKKLPEVFSPDGVERVAVDLPTLRQIHDMGRAALAVQHTRVDALTPTEGAVLAIHVQEPQLPEAAVRAALVSLEHTLAAAGWDPLPRCVAFGPEMELRWLTEEQRSWLQLMEAAKVDNLEAERDSTLRVVEEMRIAVEAMRQAVPDDRGDLHTLATQALFQAQQLEQP